MTDYNSDKILIIEDDREIAGIVEMNIRDLGIQTETVYDGISGLKLAEKGGYSLIVLDLMLPGMDGISICRRLRENNNETPILMLTARAEEIDRIIGLELGADDYMTKPFSVREMLARIKAILRRSGAPSAKEPGTVQPSISRDGLEIDFDKHLVTVNNNKKELTVKEFELLSLFIRNPEEPTAGPIFLILYGATSSKAMNIPSIPILIVCAARLRLIRQLRVTLKRSGV